MASLGRSLAMNFSGQLVSRVFSFGINMYLLRVVDNDVLGIVNVRLALLYNTVLFLTREPMRKANILRSSVPCFINIIWLSPLVALVLSAVCAQFWYMFSSSHNVPFPVLLAFPLSAIVESFAEPFAVISLRFSLTGHFAIAQSLLILLQRVFVLVLLFSTTISHLYIFAYAQVLSSVAYLVFHYSAFYYHSRRSMPELVQFPGYRSFFPQPVYGLERDSVSAVGTFFAHSILKQLMTDGSAYVMTFTEILSLKSQGEYGLERDSVSAVGTFFAHSILKQLMTDGSAYVMTFTEILSLKSQAVFDAVEKVGSLVARIVLAPVEEMCFAHFSNAINQNSKVFDKSTDQHESLIRNFSIVLHVACVIGVVVSVFGIPYSPLAVYVYGGQLLYNNGGAVLLSLYCIYLSIMAVNGITECFAMATMNNVQIFSHGGFLFVSAVAHLVLTFVLGVYLSAPGFIIANAINMLLRIGYSWRHIKGFLGDRTPPIADVLPTFSTVIFLFFALMATLFTLLVFGSTPGISHTMAHLAIGGVLFLLVVAHIISTDHVFQMLSHRLQKYAP
ncbi:unnamed protein product [Nippostrongylus brasiliensis]|uniref:Protein RFT1 homolog n=1 Tax=Nippostrongylus brasiliensis TaxID=27835 RepID=A0A0N4YW08_NIPBR|nr:unnamed protein product [Nippostrongylus brasiliensis]